MTACKHATEDLVPSIDDTGMRPEAVASERDGLVAFGWQPGSGTWAGCTACGAVWPTRAGDLAPELLAAALWSGGYRRIRATLFAALGLRPECDCGEGDGPHPADVAVMWVYPYLRGTAAASGDWASCAVRRWWSSDCLAAVRCAEGRIDGCGDDHCPEHGDGECPWAVVVA